MPPVQLPELLAELPDVEPDVAGQAGPVGVALFDAHAAALEAHENLGVRVRIEGRLEPDFELARIEVVGLRAGRIAIGTHVASGADFGVQLVLVALTADERHVPRRVGARRVGDTGGAAPRPPPAAPLPAPPPPLLPPSPRRPP